MIFKAIMLFDATKTIDFVDMVMGIRMDRARALETFDQYCFAHRTLIEYAENVLKLPYNFDWNKLSNL